MNFNIRNGLLALGIFVVLTLFVTYPLVFNLNRLIIDRSDGLLITWYLNWDIHCLTSGFSNISRCFDANIFYPYRNTLAFSDTMFPQALMAAPFVLLFNEPLLAYNINFLLGFVLTGFSMFLLISRFQKRFSVALFSGILFSFSTIHLNYMAHIQLFNIWPVIFYIYFLFGSNRKSQIFFFVLSVLTTALNLYFLLLINFSYWLFNKKKFLSIFWTTLISSVFCLPFLIPLYGVSRQFNYVRPITDAINFSLQFPQLINISSISRLSFVFGPTSKGTPAFFGLVFLVLIIFVVFKITRNYFVRKEIVTDKNILIWLFVALVSFIISLGPALHLQENTVHIGPFRAIPLPYVLFYYLLPGFSGFRTPSRWIILTAISFVVVISIYLSKRIKTWQLVLFSIIVLLEINLPFPYQRVPSVSNFPIEQKWLSTNFAGLPIIQFPIYRWDDQNGIPNETLREYYSTIHWHDMFNGFSGFSPKEWEDRVRFLQKEFPSRDSISLLKSIGIKLVLVPSDWFDRMKTYQDLKLIKEFPKTYIYELN